jgi:hypothetical protein
MATTAPDNLLYGDLHRHLEQATRPATAEEFANARQHPLAGHPYFATAVSTTEQLPTLMEYLAKTDVAASTATRVEDWERIAFEAVEDDALDDLTHVELQYSHFFIWDRTGLAPEAAVDAISDGIKRAQRQYAIPVGTIALLPRNFGPAIATEELDVILRRREQFIATDLAGDEAGVQAELFASHFNSARDAGLRTTAHAGEAAGPSSVQNVLAQLHPDRHRRATEIGATQWVSSRVSSPTRIVMSAEETSGPSARWLRVSKRSAARCAWCLRAGGVCRQRNRPRLRNDASLDCSAIVRTCASVSPTAIRAEAYSCSMLISLVAGSSVESATYTPAFSSAGS